MERIYGKGESDIHMKFGYVYDPATCTRKAEFQVKYHEPLDNNKLKIWCVCKACKEVILDILAHHDLECEVEKMRDVPEVVVFT